MDTTDTQTNTEETKSGDVAEPQSTDSTTAPKEGQSPPATETAAKEGNTFEDVVNGLVKSAKFADNGDFVVPDGTSKEAAFAIKLMLRQRKTQGSYTKGQQSLAVANAKNEVLMKKVQALLSKGAFDTLTDDDQARMEELKTSDPDAWREEMNTLEKKTVTDKGLSQALTEAETAAAIVARKELLKEHNAANPDNPITQDLIDNDIPNRIKNKLAKGKIDFSAFLVEVTAYAAKDKKVSQSDVPKTKKFNSVGGSSGSSSAQDDTSYANFII